MYFVVGRQLMNIADVSGIGKCLAKREIVTALPCNQEHAARWAVAVEERKLNAVQCSPTMSVFLDMVSPIF
jgi:hypothetical protein